MEKHIPDQQQDFELIGRFHEFELTEAELRTFENRLENDPVFQKRFRLYEEMEQHIDQQFPAAQSEDFRKILTAPPATEKQEAVVRPLFNRRIWGIAATIALLLVAGLWWLTGPTTLKDPVALADYYWDGTNKEHLFSGAQRGEGDPDPDQAAYTFFRTIRDYMEKGEYSTMIDQLEIYKSTTPPPIPFEDDADWLLAIAYVANNQAENARFVLEQIIEAYPARREKARQLLADVEALEGEGEVRK